jgi:hypothetical protein
MTVLRQGDEELHDEQGNHIEPETKAAKQRMKRHLDRHWLAGMPDDVVQVAHELAAADAAVVTARKRAIDVAREHLGRGEVLQGDVARLYGIDPRTLRDWLMYGAAQRRNK